MDERFTAQAKEIIEKIIYITIATVCEDGMPWNTPVYASYDEQYNFFWISTQDSQHSKNIAHSSQVFLVIYDSTVQEGTGRGVYVKARAAELTDEDEITHALKYHYGRKNKSPRPVTDFMGPASRRVYKAIPEMFWINTDEKVDGHHIDSRVKLDLL